MRLARFLPLSTGVETLTPLATTGSDLPSFAMAVFAPFRDAWLAARARFATLVAAGSAAGAVWVEAYHGSVVLLGDVPTMAVRAELERAVRALPGVVGVENRLRVDAEHLAICVPGVRRIVSDVAVPIHADIGRKADAA